MLYVYNVVLRLSSPAAWNPFGWRVSEKLRSPFLYYLVSYSFEPLLYMPMSRWPCTVACDTLVACGVNGPVSCSIPHNATVPWHVQCGTMIACSVRVVQTDLSILSRPGAVFHTGVLHETTVALVPQGGIGYSDRC